MGISASLYDCCLWYLFLLAHAFHISLLQRLRLEKQEGLVIELDARSLKFKCATSYIRGTPARAWSFILVAFPQFVPIQNLSHYVQIVAPSEKCLDGRLKLKRVALMPSITTRLSETVDKTYVPLDSGKFAYLRVYASWLVHLHPLRTQSYLDCVTGLSLLQIIMTVASVLFLSPRALRWHCALDSHVVLRSSMRITCEVIICAEGHRAHGITRPTCLGAILSKYSHARLDQATTTFHHPAENPYSEVQCPITSSLPICRKPDLGLSTQGACPK